MIKLSLNIFSIIIKDELFLPNFFSHFLISSCSRSHFVYNVGMFLLKCNIKWQIIMIQDQQYNNVEGASLSS